MTRKDKEREVILLLQRLTGSTLGGRNLLADVYSRMRGCGNYDVLLSNYDVLLNNRRRDIG